MPLSRPLPRSRRAFLLAALLLPTATALTACGFRLRGPQRMDFARLYIGVPAQTELGAQLRRLVATTGSTVVVEDPAEAEARLQILANARSREILSLTGAGKVREYQLNQSLQFQLLDHAGKTLIPPTTLAARRDYNFDEDAVLGKAQEEEMLYRDMQDDLVQQLMRRLSAYRRSG